MSVRNACIELRTLSGGGSEWPVKMGGTPPPRFSEVLEIEGNEQEIGRILSDAEKP